MSYYHQQPYAPQPLPPRRKRPRKVWWFVAVAMVVLAPILFVGSLVTVFSPMAREDAVFTADGVAQVDLPAGEERVIFLDEPGEVACTVTDGAGNPIELQPVTGDFTYNGWRAVNRFDTGDGNVTFECAGSSPTSQIRIAQAPSTGGFVAVLIIGVVGPLVFGGAGFIMLIILTVLRASGAPRDQVLPQA